MRNQINCALNFKYFGAVRHHEGVLWQSRKKYVYVDNKHYARTILVILFVWQMWQYTGSWTVARHHVCLTLNILGQLPKYRTIEWRCFTTVQLWCSYQLLPCFPNAKIIVFWRNELWILNFENERRSFCTVVNERTKMNENERTKLSESLLYCLNSSKISY